MAGVFGERDRYLRAIEDEFDAEIHARSNEISIDGPQEAQAAKVLEELVVIVEQGQNLEPEAVRRAIEMVRNGDRPSEILTDRVLTTARGKAVKPKTTGQKLYVDAIRANTVTFGIGPAGTGKSWLAVACAVQAWQDKQVERIVLTRPVVEAGESLGYLPGDLMAKVDPYLRPLYDALHDMVGLEKASKLFEGNVVEVAPLAFMRGRTLNHSFVILDEAQNTTDEQMKMFLTRIGENSKVVVTGDDTQADLPGKRSGLVGIDRTLAGIEGLAFVRLSASDIVRHRIVQDIVNAYEREAAKRTTRRGRGSKR